MAAPMVQLNQGGWRGAPNGGQLLDPAYVRAAGSAIVATGWPSPAWPEYGYTVWALPEDEVDPTVFSQQVPRPSLPTPYPCCLTRSCRVHGYHPAPAAPPAIRAWVAAAGRATKLARPSASIAWAGSE